MKQIQQPVKIFCSYAHEDQVFVHELITHFASLKRIYTWIFWTDMEIPAGAEWEQTIQEHLDTAHVILLLVSPDFMNSDYCYSKEMKRALERHEQKEACVIPIIIRSVAHWQDTPLGKLQALPAGGKPITGHYWLKADDAFNHLIKEISQAIGAFTEGNQGNTTQPALVEITTPEPSDMVVLSEPQLSALSRTPDHPIWIEKAGAKSFEQQEDAYDFLLSLIRRYGAKEAVFLQYSCQTSMPVLRKLLRMRANVTVFIQHEETAAKIGSQFQADRIIRTTRSLRSDLGDALLEPEKLKIYKYRSPCSMSAIKIDNRVLYMGWYTYEQKMPANEGAYATDTIDLSGHDRAAMVTWKGTNDLQTLDEIADIGEEINDFQKFSRTFNVLERNYRQYAEIVSI